MGMFEGLDELDCDQWETVVLVHSPVIRCIGKGNCFTTYSVSLKSNNTCFAQPFSCVHRRYSEFVHLRNLLKEHHPNIEPPPLPPKKLFNRFDQSFINERTEGLQDFIGKLLNVPVYLSNKALHLFLQTFCTMSEIDKQVSGDEDTMPTSVTHDFDSCSDTSSDVGSPVSISELDGSEPIEVGVEARDWSDTCDVKPSEPKHLSDPIPILHPYLRKTLVGGSCPVTSLHASPTGSNTETTLSVTRHVSFCDKVKVAVVRDQFWNIGTRPIRTC